MSPIASQNTYIMREQSRNTVQKIMQEQSTDTLVSHPSWLALGLLFVAFNIVTITTP